VSDGGHRCESTASLGLDHIVRRALGGETTAENLHPLCRSHNQHTARKLLGPLFARERRRPMALDPAQRDLRGAKVRAKRCVRIRSSKPIRRQSAHCPANYPCNYGR
jgi:hypothetical protein